eukprot:TRINITY_DN297_c1_g2_i1.p1 TRINITY_DN297_c1_g2~~TRINITY_DN297_c1_g2_i1.p1  ORF type:complete len:745 (+),score=146.56 TRINITY_DN297_c1_g2_i1:98-2236(+)
MWWSSGTGQARSRSGGREHHGGLSRSYEEERRSRRESRSSRGSSRGRSRSHSPIPAERSLIQPAAAAACGVLILVVAVIAIREQGQAAARVAEERQAARRVRGFYLLNDDGNVGEDPTGEEERHAADWAAALRAPVKCSQGRPCGEPPATPPPVEPVPSVKQTPVPLPPDPRPRLCCERDLSRPCPEGWTIVGIPGYRVANVPWRWRGTCPRLVRSHVAEITETTATLPARCTPPHGYAGSCGEEAPPCDPRARVRWAERCNATWACAQEVLLCEWQRCPPKCYFGNTEPPSERGGASCAPDYVKQPVTLITHFPTDTAGMTPERRLELANALRCNIAHPHVAKIHLLLEPGEEELQVRAAMRDAQTMAEKIKALYRLLKDSAVLSQASFDTWKSRIIVEGKNASARGTQKNTTLDELIDSFVVGGPRSTGTCAPMLDRCGKARLSILSQRMLYSDALHFLSDRESFQGRYVLLARPDHSVAAGFGDLGRLSLLAPPGSVAALTPYDDVNCFAIDSAAAADSEDGSDGACDCRTSNGDCGSRAYLFKAPLPSEVMQASLTQLPSADVRGQVVALPSGLLQWAGVHVDADLPFHASPGADAIFLEVLRHHGLRVDNRCGTLRVRRHRCFAPPNQGPGALSLMLQRRPVGPFPAPPVHVRLARWWTQHNHSWPLHPWRHAPPRLEGARTLATEWQPAGVWFAAARPHTVPAPPR